MSNSVHFLVTYGTGITLVDSDLKSKVSFASYADLTTTVKALRAGGDYVVSLPVSRNQAAGIPNVAALAKLGAAAAAASDTDSAGWAAALQQLIDDGYVIVGN